MYCTIVGDQNDAALTMGNLAGQGATIMKRKLMNILGKGPNYALFLTNAAATKVWAQARLLRRFWCCSNCGHAISAFFCQLGMKN
jgi:hypothetical protein